MSSNKSKKNKKSKAAKPAAAAAAKAVEPEPEPDTEQDTTPTPTKTAAAPEPTSTEAVTPAPAPAPAPVVTASAAPEPVGVKSAEPEKPTAAAAAVVVVEPAAAAGEAPKNAVVEAAEVAASTKPPVTVYPTAAAVIASAYGSTASSAAAGEAPPIKQSARASGGYGTTSHHNDVTVNVGGVTGASTGGGSGDDSSTADTNRHHKQSSSHEDRILYHTNEEYIGPQSKPLSLCYLFILVLGWIGVVVAFGGIMHTVNKPANNDPQPNTGPVQCSFYVNHYSCVGFSGEIYGSGDNGCPVLNQMTGGSPDDGSQRYVCAECIKGSRGVIGTGFFAFLLLTINIVLVAMRLTNKDYYVPGIGTNRKKYLRMETTLTVLANLFLLFTLIAWSTTCLAQTRKSLNFDTGVVIATGWWFVLVCWLLLWIGSVISAKLNGNPCCPVTNAQWATDLIAVQSDVVTNGPFGTKPDKVLNIILLVGMFLSFIGTWVGFGGELHHIAVPDTFTDATNQLSFSWKSYTWLGSTESFATCIGDSAAPLGQTFCSTCQSGGQLFLAFTVFAFLCLFANLVLWILRVSRRLKRAGMLTIEFYLLLAAAGCMLVGICAWGGSCFSITMDHVSAENAIGTGYGYYVFSWILLLFECLLVWIIRERAGEGPENSNDDGTGGTRGERTALRSGEASGLSSGQPSLPAVSSVSTPITTSGGDGFEPIPSGSGDSL